MLQTCDFSKDRISFCVFYLLMYRTKATHGLTEFSRQHIGDAFGIYSRLGLGLALILVLCLTVEIPGPNSPNSPGLHRVIFVWKGPCQHILRSNQRDHAVDILQERGAEEFSS
jgi:hypothetical protein